jgi:hypothetical protein
MPQKWGHSIPGHVKNFYISFIKIKKWQFGISELPQYKMRIAYISELGASAVYYVHDIDVVDMGLEF